jgi:acetyl esterase/lipase
MRKLTLILISVVTISATLSAQNTIQKEILIYATKDGQKLFFDKYVDNRTQFTGKRPVIIYVHGGGFSTGSSKNALQIKYNKHFAAQGFVSISINYRLTIKADTLCDSRANRIPLCTHLHWPGSEIVPSVVQQSL